MIRMKAFEIYRQRGGVPGHEMEDWLKAEQLINRELQGGAIQARIEPGVKPTETGGISPPRVEPKTFGGYKRKG
jgi:hypothetical protein